MPLTSIQWSKIREKEASLSDALKRDPLTCYYEGYFHVTLNTRDEAPTLGYMAGSPDAPDGSLDAPRCVLTNLGKGVSQAWESIPDFHPCADLIDWIIMPEHVHALIHMRQMPGKKREHLGRVINGVMIGCTHVYWDILGIDWRNMPGRTEGSNRGAPRKYTDRDHMRSFRGPALFVRGYNDVEAITQEEVETKRQYIRNNPRKRLIAKSHSDCFRISRNNHSKNWTQQKALSAVAADRWICRDFAKCQQLQANIINRLKAGMGIDFLGNKALLAAERKVSLVCHRSDIALFEQQRASVLKAAREGAVVVSAFVSPRERDIMKQLMVEQLPFIELMDNGFSERYRPLGKAFYSVAEKRHVQLTCWNYKFQKNTEVSREMCLVMNELVRLISGKEDCWWKM